ncbi:MAG TPA: MXAN_5187 family protein, partial [Polyangiaceae bacterium]|nr:MXAN_5187 family protein [Polyangiaceae bacterium]
MLASRFWYVVLALLVGAATFLLFLATSMYNRAGARAMGEALSSDSQVVTWYLSNDARQRSAQLISFGVDQDIARSLQKSSDNDQKVPDEAREKALTALKKVNGAIPADQAFDAVFAVDAHGRVVAHVGYEQASGNQDFELGGYPVVADALRGYIRDDTLVLDRIYRVVARPVEADTSQMPAGAIVGMRILDDRFARELSSRTGAAIAFYTSGARVSSGAPETFNSAQLDQIVGDFASLERDDDYQTKGRSKVRTIAGMVGVQYSKLPGEAWKLGAGYAVAREPKAVSGPLGFLEKADDQDKANAHVALAVAIAVAGALIGIVFTLLEHTRPIHNFRLEVQKLAKGESDQLQPSRFRGAFRKIASDLNDGVDKILAKGGGPRRGPADLKEVLGDLPAEPQMSAFSFPGENLPAVSSGALGPQSAPHSASKPLPTAPGRNLPKPPGRGAANLDTTMEAQADVPFSAGAAPSGGGGPVSEVDEWRAVYQDFVALKQQCG